MNRTLVGALALAALSGCSQYENQGIFYFTLPVMTNAECSINYNENIVDSDPPVGAEPTTDWVFDSEVTLSPSANFMQVFADRTGAAIVQIGNETYVGTEDKDVITVSWTGTTDDHETMTNSGADYSYTHDIVSTSLTTITLTRNKETKGFDGNWSSKTDRAESSVESDRWDVDEVGNSGQINNAIFSDLEGTGSNGAEQDDCESDPCRVEVTESCSGSVGFTAQETNLSDDAFEGVKSAGQPAGA